MSDKGEVKRMSDKGEVKRMSDKAKIVIVGTVVDDEPTGFVFDCGGEIAATELKDGDVLYGGYTVGELREMAAG